MSSPFGAYGGFKYQSSQSRALGSITVESYQKVYDDQSKFLSKMAGDVSYLAAASRKTQEGVDKANENIIQQFQDFINDIIALLGGGGGASGFDFGDLKYVFIAIGSLLGLTDENGKIVLPINLFSAAWHFFSNWILPVDNFKEAINFIVDGFIATILNIFGDIPIVGQALEQLAAIISDMRDILGPLFDALQALMDAFSLDINDSDGIFGLFGIFAPILNAIATALDGIVLPDFSALFHVIAQWTIPFVDIIAQVIEWFATLIHTVINLPGNIISNVADVITVVMQALAPIMDIIVFVVQALNPVVNAILSVLGFFGFGSSGGGGFSLSNLFGGGIPAGAITNTQVNLLPSPVFKGGSVLEGSEWSIDTDDSRTADSSGSLSITADGNSHAIRSGKTPSDTMAVGVGQTLVGSIFVKCEDVALNGEVQVEWQVIPFSLGVKGEPIVLDTYSPTAADLDWPGHELSGEYIVPSGVTSIQTRIVINRSAVTGVFKFDDANASQVPQISQGLISGLAGTFGGIVGQIQAVVDTIFNAVSGGVGTVYNGLEGLADILKNIPFGNILGVGGPANIGASVLGFLGSLAGGLVGSLGDGIASIADIFNIANLIGTKASQGSNAWEILGIQNNSSIASGFLVSGQSNFDLSTIAFGSAANFISATQSASPAAAIRIKKSLSIGVISWLGYGVTNISQFYINVWKINPDKSRDLVHHSQNQVGILSASATSTNPEYHFYNLDDHSIAGAAGDNYEIEWVPVGSGTHHIVGSVTGSWLPGHPTATTAIYASVRNNSSSPNSPPSTIAAGSVVAWASVPWFEIAIDSGDTDNYYDPVTIYLTDAQTVSIPKWANYIDAVPLGGGGSGGHSEIIGFFGGPGQPGKFNPVTWARGVDFGDDVTDIVFAHGAIAVGDESGSGSDGGTATLSIAGHTQVAAGGAAGHGATLGQHLPAQGAESIEYNGHTFVAGGVQNSYASAGTNPGGGGTGAGGQLFTFQPGGNGGRPAAWIRFRQLPVDGESAGWDQIAPSPPTLVLDTRTFSTLTVIASGSTDS